MTKNLAMIMNHKLWTLSLNCENTIIQSHNIIINIIIITIKIIIILIIVIIIIIIIIVLLIGPKNASTCVIACRKKLLKGNTVDRHWKL